jgi:surface antigen
MKKRYAFLLAGTAAIAVGAGAAFAQPDEFPDASGSYDNNGHRAIYVDDRDYDGPPAVYREGDYERNCHRGNAAAGTVFGAIGGGLIGGAASHGNAGAVVGGVLLGGLLGNALSRDIDCDDQRYAFNVYADGFNGEIGRRYEWRHGDDYGYFTPTREYREDGLRCRAFIETTYRHGQEYDHQGVACYEGDGYWHFR